MNAKSNVVAGMPLERLAERLLPRVIAWFGQRRLSILIYHQVLLERDYLRPTEPTVEEFRWQMALLSKYFTPLPLLRAIRMLGEGTLPSRAVCVTFDDGYADNATLAQPVLKEFGIPATIFVATGYLNGGRMWNDSIIESVRRAPEGVLDLREIGLGRYMHLTDQQVALRHLREILAIIKYWDGDRRAAAIDYLNSTVVNLPDDLMLTDKQVKNLFADGTEIGAHTHSHPILAKIGMRNAETEITRGKEILEALLGKKLQLFAYPNGVPGRDFLEDHCALVRALGFEAAVSTRWGVSDETTDRWCLPRFTPWDRTPLRFLVRLLRNTRNLQ